MVVVAAWRCWPVHVELSDLQHARCRQSLQASPNFTLQNRFCKGFSWNFLLENLAKSCVQRVEIQAKTNMQKRLQRMILEPSHILLFSAA